MESAIVREDLEHITKTGPPWGALEGRNVLITGAGGFLAAYLVKTILYLNDTRFKDKAKVYALVRNRENAQKTFEHYQGRKDLELLVQDVCEPVNLKGTVHYIIHAASQASPKHFGKDPVGTLKPNTIGTHNLLELARKKDAEGFLYFSSGEIYGAVETDRLPITESTHGYLDPMNVRSCYAESKRMGETMCASWNSQYGTPTKIVRPFHTYGPGMRFDDGRVFADFVSDIVHRRDINMKSDGAAVRAFCYLADATSGYFNVLLKGKAGEAYNIGSDTCRTSILELAKTLVALFPEYGLKIKVMETTRTGEYLKSPVRSIYPDISKAKALGWEPTFSIEEGFKRTVRSYMQACPPKAEQDHERGF